MFLINSHPMRIGFVPYFGPDRRRRRLRRMDLKAWKKKKTGQNANDGTRKCVSRSGWIAFGFRAFKWDFLRDLATELPLYTVRTKTTRRPAVWGNVIRIILFFVRRNAIILCDERRFRDRNAIMRSRIHTSISMLLRTKKKKIEKNKRNEYISFSR